MDEFLHGPPVYGLSEAIRHARLQLIRTVREHSTSPALVVRLRAEELALQAVAFPARDEPLLHRDEYQALIESIKSRFHAEYEG